MWEPCCAYKVVFFFADKFAPSKFMAACNSFPTVFLQEREATSSDRMSVGFIGAGQLAHALVKGFTAAGMATFFLVQAWQCTESNFTDLKPKDKNAAKHYTYNKD